MAMIYQTKEGDTVDYIAWRIYGASNQGMTEQILNANLGLADQGAVLPAGLLINIPDQPLYTPKKGVKLWD